MPASRGGPGPGAVAVGAVVLFLCYLRLSRTYADGSDSADQALQAWDMLHGNLLLHGWTVGDVSYYTTEIPQYALVELVHGLGSGVVHVASAMTYTLLLLCVGLLAKGRTTGRDGIVRALVAIGIMLAPQLGNGIHLLLSQPDHLGTQVPLLVIFIIVDRAPRRWYVPAAVAVLLTWVLVSDQVALFDAAAPLAVVCGVRALYAVVRERKPLASQWFELSLALAGVVSFGAAKLITAVINRAGGYTGLPLKTVPTPLHLLPTHFVLTMEGILNIYGADFFTVSKGNLWGPASGTLGTTVAVVIAVVHLVGVALAVWGVSRAFRRFFSSDLIASLLAAGIVFNLAAYVFSIDPQTLFDTREILALLPFGAVLAGRLLTGSLARARLEPALVARACVLCDRPGVRGRAACGVRQRAAGRRLARGAPPVHRARHVHRGEHHHARQRRPRRDQNGVLADHRRRAQGLRIGGLLVRPSDQLRQLRPVKHGRRELRANPGKRRVRRPPA